MDKRHFVGERAFCRYICWMAPFMVIGNRVKDFFRWPALCLHADKDKCNNCKLCNKKCPMSLDVNGMVQKGSMINPECILCGCCIDACPRSVLRYHF
ncbi:MAG: 4Fe-4S dicluster domain-containing protein [Candidatus Omnitrophota bacterium]